MKHKRKIVKTTSYVAGIFAIASALLVMVLFIMSALGVIFPRKESIMLHTDTLSKIYDATPLSGGTMTLKYGELHSGHVLEVLEECTYTKVGKYKNEPSYRIVDASGADVTNMYDIRADFGNIIIAARPLTVQSPSKTKRYDGVELISDEIYVFGGKLVKGDSFICYSKTSITDPGSKQILPTYHIVDENGADVTDQYAITNDLGILTIRSLPITIVTASAEKVYDGKPLSSDEWECLGTLLEGHKVAVTCITEKSDVGTFQNEAEVQFRDKDGNDVSQLYNVDMKYGTLTISPLPLHIMTGNATKEYDGTRLSCDTWEIVSGKLAAGEKIDLRSFTVLNAIGVTENKMNFAITDAKGNDITYRYQITQETGELCITPRSITIRTGSAVKVYDGSALVCEEYEIIKGSLCEGDTLEVAFSSMVNIGYTPNYIINYSIHRQTEGGGITDVSENYRISYDYGTLTVTAK